MTQNCGTAILVIQKIDEKDMYGCPERQQSKVPYVLRKSEECKCHAEREMCEGRLVECKSALFSNSAHHDAYIDSNPGEEHHHGKSMEKFSSSI